jgi:hypothetical protein
MFEYRLCRTKTDALSFGKGSQQELNSVLQDLQNETNDWTFQTTWVRGRLDARQAPSDGRAFGNVDRAEVGNELGFAEGIELDFFARLSCRDTICIYLLPKEQDGFWS